VIPEQEEPVWDPGRYVPDVIVINLGNNDFNVLDEENVPTAPPAEPFKAAYATFVRRLRDYYPAAHIICSIGPMMNDNYPPGRGHWTLMQQYVREMVDSLNAEGDWAVHYFAYTPILSDPYGDDWHPTAASHAAMAQEIGDFIEGLGW
jgi:lysophospholipase L1-like esterase